MNGLRSVELVRFMLENDLVDTVDLGCGLLADPAFTEEAKKEMCFTTYAQLLLSAIPEL